MLICIRRRCSERLYRRIFGRQAVDTRIYMGAIIYFVRVAFVSLLASYTAHGKKLVILEPNIRLDFFSIKVAFSSLCRSVQELFHSGLIFHMVSNANGWEFHIPRVRVLYVCETFSEVPLNRN